MAENIDQTEKTLLEAMSVDDASLKTDYKALSGRPLPKEEKKADMKDIIEAIKLVFDPEIPINVYDMGLIYKIDQKENGHVDIDMTLTAPGCPVAGILPQQVADSVAAIKGVGTVEVKIVWEPLWTTDRLTDEAKLALNLF